MEEEMTSVLVILATSFWRVSEKCLDHVIDLPSLQSIVLYRAFVGVVEYSVSSMIVS